MKTKITKLLTALVLITSISFAQAPLKEYKAGHIFYISLPEYMSKTAGLNSSSTIEYKNAVKDVYGFVIEDNKEILTLAELKYSSINEFYEDFIKDFLEGEKNKKAGTPKFQKKGDISFAEADVTYYDEEVKGDIYYLVGIVETKASYYKVLSWCVAENKTKFKADFQKILYSLRD
jgi:hypothetical protein